MTFLLYGRIYWNIHTSTDKDGGGGDERIPLPNATA